MAFHTVLVAYCVESDTPEHAQEILLADLPNVRDHKHPYLDCWWLAEDASVDGSDNDSAVFVPYGMQSEGRALVQSLYDQAYGGRP